MDQIGHCPVCGAALANARCPRCSPEPVADGNPYQPPDALSPPGLPTVWVEALAERRPRVWPSVVMAILAIPIAIIVSTAALLLALALYGPANWMASPQKLMDWVGEFAATPVGFMIVFLPGQLVFATLAIGVGAFSRQPLLERLALVRGRMPGWSIPALMVATPLVPMLTMLAIPWLGESPSEQMKFLDQLFRDPTGLMAWFIVGFVSIVPAIVEEALFRGYVQSRLLRRWPAFFAIAFTSVMFSAAHVDPQHVIAVFPLSVWLGIVAWRAGSIWPAVACHFANNFVGSLFSRFGGEPTEAALDVATLLPLGICGLAFIPAAYALLRFGRPAAPSELA